MEEDMKREVPDEASSSHSQPVSHEDGNAAPDDGSEQLVRRRLEADNCIKNHVIMAMGTGLIPSTLVDVVGITAIEVKMIGSLARIHEFPIPTRLVLMKILVSLVGSIGPVYFSNKMHSALKSVPLVGHAVYVGMLSLTGGASVYAVGKLFQKHFESGGTFLSSENSILRNFYKKKFEEGKRTVPTFTKEKNSESVPAT